MLFYFSHVGTDSIITRSCLISVLTNDANVSTARLSCEEELSVISSFCLQTCVGSRAADSFEFVTDVKPTREQSLVNVNTLLSL